MLALNEEDCCSRSNYINSTLHIPLVININCWLWFLEILYFLNHHFSLKIKRNRDCLFHNNHNYQYWISSYMWKKDFIYVLKSITFYFAHVGDFIRQKRLNQVQHSCQRDYSLIHLHFSFSPWFFLLKLLGNEFIYFI